MSKGSSPEERAKAIPLPSGDMRGFRSLTPVSDVNWTEPVPSRFIKKICSSGESRVNLMKAIFSSPQASVPTALITQSLALALAFGVGVAEGWVGVGVAAGGA